MSSRINELLASILNSVLGRDVRQSIHDAIEECYRDVDSTKTAALEAMTAAAVSAGNASTAANTATTKASEAAASSASASSAATAAATSATTAGTAADTATAKAAEVADAISDWNSTLTNYDDRIDAAEAQISAELALCSTARSNANSAAQDATSAANAADAAARAANAAASQLVDSELSSTSEKAVQNKVIKAALDTKYTLPQGGIPATDLAAAVQTSLGLADSALQNHQDISGKADKVSNPTSGNFAALDANGNLVDSGHKHGDYLTEHQSLAGYLRTSSLEAKTSAMTQAVGYDSEHGTLWTTPGSGGGTGGGVTDYSNLTGKPSINGVELGGNKTTAQLGLGMTAIQVTLTSNGWSNGTQTVSNAAFLASGYVYFIKPSSASKSAYKAAGIDADDITTDGSMTFHCDTPPSNDITVDIAMGVAS